MHDGFPSSFKVPQPVATAFVPIYVDTSHFTQWQKNPKTIERYFHGKMKEKKNPPKSLVNHLFG